MVFIFDKKKVVFGFENPLKEIVKDS